MIRKISFENFYSFKHRQTISFIGPRKNGPDYSKSKSGESISKIASFIGANASGKTNIIRLFSFLAYAIQSTGETGNKNKLSSAYKTYFNNNKPLKIEVEFEIEDSIYFYFVEFQNDKFVYEKLLSKYFEKYAKPKRIFERKEDKLFFNNALSEKVTKEFVIDNLKDDYSLIAFLNNNYKNKIINSIYNYFSNFETNINEAGEFNSHIANANVLKSISENKKLRDKVEGILKKFDLGFSSIEFEKGNENTLVYGTHKIGNRIEKIPYNYESRGTRSLLTTLTRILLALVDDSFVIIDEIEMGIHPIALAKIISYFIEENQSGKSQLIFSSHLHTSFINKLDMHQLFLVEKNNNCESEVFSLSEIKGVRTDDNYYKKYMSGAYGAFPDIKI